MCEEELSSSSLFARGVNSCHCLSSSSNSNESKNTNVVALLENKPMRCSKMQNEKEQRGKYEKKFNMSEKKIKHMQSLIDEKDSIVNSNEKKHGTLDEKYSHIANQLLNHDVIKDEDHNENNDVLMNCLLSWMIVLLLSMLVTFSIHCHQS